MFVVNSGIPRSVSDDSEVVSVIVTMEHSSEIRGIIVSREYIK